MEARNLLEAFNSPSEENGYMQVCVDKWGPLCEGISDPYTLGITAMLLENETHHLTGMNEETFDRDTGRYAKFIFPIIRRVWPNLIANSIVSVQPMTAPIGAIFYFQYQYGTTKGDITAGMDMIENFDANYSLASLSVVDEHPTGWDGNGTCKVFSATLAHRPIWPGTVTVTATIGAVAVEAVDSGENGDLVGTGVEGTLNYESGKVTVSFNTAPDNATTVVVDYQYEGESDASAVPEMNIDIQMEEVRAKSRKLKALWSTEASDDLRALHGIDAETEVVSGISNEIALEIDRSIIARLLGCGTANTGTWDRAVPATGISEVDHVRSMLTVIGTVSNKVYQDTLRRPANWLVTSPQMSAVMDALPEYTPVSPDETVAAIGLQKVGVLSGRWTVYVDPFMTGTNQSKILVGYKGSSFMDAGFAYCPYVPLQMTPTFLDPGSFQFKKGLRTRYAQKLINKKYYGIITVNNLT